MTALAWASRKGREQVVDVLLKAGANPGIQSHGHWTALMMATDEGHRGVIKALLERKADISITSKVGRCIIV